MFICLVCSVCSDVTRQDTGVAVHSVCVQMWRDKTQVWLFIQCVFRCDETRQRCGCSFSVCSDVTRQDTGVAVHSVCVQMWRDKTQVWLWGVCVECVKAGHRIAEHSESVKVWCCGCCARYCWCKESSMWRRGAWMSSGQRCAATLMSHKASTVASSKDLFFFICLLVWNSGLASHVWIALWRPVPWQHRKRGR